jgi:hypothetical protein
MGAGTVCQDGKAAFHGGLIWHAEISFFTCFLAAQILKINNRFHSGANLLYIKKGNKNDRIQNEQDQLSNRKLGQNDA